MSASQNTEGGPPQIRRHVLLLNASYEPLTTVSLRRAILLVLREKAEVVHSDSTGAVLHSSSMVLSVPSVIRLLRYIRVPYRRRIPLTRVALMRRDGYHCAYCDRRAETIDHVIPRSRGDSTSGRTWWRPVNHVITARPTAFWKNSVGN